MFKLIRFLSKKEWLFFFCSVLFMISQVWLDLELPLYMSEITTLVETEGSAMKDIWSAGGMMLLCSFGSLIASCAVTFFAARISAGFSGRLRRELFYKVSSFSMEEINSFSTASLITRTTNDVMQVQGLIIMAMQIVLKAPLMAVWAIMRIAGKAWQWTTATAIAVGIMMVLLTIVMIIVFPRFKEIQSLQDAINHATRENLSGIRVVRAYNAEKYQEQKFDKANLRLLKNQIFANRTVSIMSPFMTVTMNGLSISIYWIGALLINAAVVNGVADVAQRVNIFADMIVFMTYALQIIMSFIMVVMIMVIAPRALVAAGRINEVLETEPKILDGGQSFSEEDIPEERRGEVEFRNVSFAYPGGKGSVLENISFKADKGEMVAIIGSTGAGKSTLINLIPRFYDATEGEVLVDGINVKDYKLEKLCKKLGYISQKAVMFSGTVEQNVAFGLNADPDRVETALEVSQSAEFVNENPDGTEAHISQGGTNISGGQKQRLSIARALCRKSEVLIFDDTFSALDFKTDRELREALKSETKGVTVFVVAQRIGTVMGADKIIVLDEGRIVGMGKHRELLDSCEVYRQIALSQLSEEELKI